MDMLKKFRGKNNCAQSPQRLPREQFYNMSPNSKRVQFSPWLYQRRKCDLSPPVRAHNLLCTARVRIVFMNVSPR